jgi:hypothetical protein
MFAIYVYFIEQRERAKREREREREEGVQWERYYRMNAWQKGKKLFTTTVHYHKRLPYYDTSIKKPETSLVHKRINYIFLYK